MPDDSSQPVHVAVGVVPNHSGQILLTQRARDAHQGGLWEFPGGKLAAGESVYQALVRELAEEIGINVLSAKPLITVAHAYADKSVFLDVWWVDSYEGSVHSREGQAMQWLPAAQLHTVAMPAADNPIITAINLPRFYAVTPDFQAEAQSLSQYQESLQALLQQPMISLLQLRCPSLADEDYKSLATSLLEQRTNNGPKILLNRGLDLVLELGADGVHLSTAAMQQVDSAWVQRCQQKPLLVAASCHTREELELAESLAVDFAVLGSVKPTSSHPAAVPLGWEQFQALVRGVSVPVFAIGGLTMDDYAESIDHGAQGIAGISTFSQLASVWNKLKNSRLIGKKGNSK